MKTSNVLSRILFCPPGNCVVVTFGFVLQFSVEFGKRWKVSVLGATSCCVVGVVWSSSAGLNRMMQGGAIEGQQNPPLDSCMHNPFTPTCGQLGGPTHGSPLEPVHTQTFESSSRRVVLASAQVCSAVLWGGLPQLTTPPGPGLGCQSWQGLSCVNKTHQTQTLPGRRNVSGNLAKQNRYT